MIFLLALLPATMITIAGYIVLYVANRSEGGFRAFGKYLSFWAFTLAGLVILGALFAAAHHRHGAADWRVMHGPWQEGPREDARSLPAPDSQPPRNPPPASPPVAPPTQ
jgi:hypothetical protein